MVGQPDAASSYAFYEELDRWLGPWGESGYPIGYGKHYSLAFTTNRHLMRNPTARRWVWKTARLLQEALLDFVLGRMAAGTLEALTEPELRAAAFASHPRAYDRAGLAMVALVAPELIPVIATIPLAELDPRSDNFTLSVQQV